MAHPDPATESHLAAVSVVGDAFDDAVISLVSLDAGLRLVAGNRAWRSLAPTAAGPRGWLDAFDAVSQARITAELHELMPGAPPSVICARGVDGHSEFELRASSVDTARPGAAGVSVAILDVTDRAQREAVLAFDATHDDLTGLLNRAALFPVLEQALARHRRHNDILAVLFIDLDHFKDVNDRHGHAAGDDVLRVFAGRLRRAARVEDTIARIGGDEFAVFCEGLTAREDAIHVAARLIEATAQPFEGAAADMKISATVGIAYAAAGCDTPRSLLEEADVTMYDDKRLRHATETLSPPDTAPDGECTVDAVIRRLEGIDVDVTTE